MSTQSAITPVLAISDMISTSEGIRFASSMRIDLAEGRDYRAAVRRAFRTLWSHRLGYSSHLSDAGWEDLTVIADRLGIEL